MSLEKPYVEEKIITPMKSIRIVSTENPAFDITVNIAIAKKAEIILSTGGTYDLWDYNGDGTISNVDNPDYIIVTLEKEAGSQLKLWDRPNASPYSTWTWNPTLKTFSLDANPKVVIGIEKNILKPYTPIKLLSASSPGTKWNIVITQAPLVDTGVLDIKVITGSHSGIVCPYEYTKIDHDLNKSVGGDYIYLCKKTGTSSRGLTGLQMVYASGSGDTYCPSGTVKVPGELNKGAGECTDNIYYCKTLGEPPFIQDVKTDNVGSGTTQFPYSGWPGWSAVTDSGGTPIDANKGTDACLHKKTDTIFTRYTAPKSMASYCSIGFNFDHPRCKKWCNDNSAACIETKGNVCSALGEKMWDTDFCRRFCIKADSKTRGKYCNENMNKYCDLTKYPTNAKSVACGCVNSQFPGIKGFCFDPSCINGKSYQLSTQPSKLCIGASCIQYASGKGSDYYQKTKQVMCCDSSTGKMAKRGSGAKCEVVPDSGNGGIPPSKKTDVTVLGVFGVSSSSSLSCCFLLILLFLIYYLLD